MIICFLLGGGEQLLCRDRQCNPGFAEEKVEA